VDQEIQQVLTGVPTRGFEDPVRCKDGSRCWIVWNVECLADYEEGPAILAVGQDITTLKQAQEQAVQSARLAAIGQMVAGLAHESRNALQLIQASLEMLALEVEDRPEALELIASIQGAEDRLHRLFDDIRGYAAPIQLERDIYDMARVWRGVWEQLAPQRNGRQSLLREHTEGIELSSAVDLFSLERVFRNIFENSLAACRDPVEIDIHCSGAKIAGRSALQIAVRDNGPGLTSEQKQKIFNPFYTTKRQGTGLGMAIAKRIVEAHGGGIAVGNDGFPGAEILITLPRETA
jgi:two-component system, LuxR family, sensor kinase FixL